MKRIFTFVGALLVILSMTGCGDGDQRGALSEEQAQAFIGQVVQARDAAIMSGDASGYAAFFAPGVWPARTTRARDDDPSVLAQLRARMREQGSDILDTSTTVDHVRVEPDGEGYVVRYTAHSVWHISVGNHPIPGPGQSGAEYRVTLRVEGGQTKITSFGYAGEVPPESRNDIQVPGPADFGISPLVAGSELETTTPPLVSSGPSASPAHRYVDFPNRYDARAAALYADAHADTGTYNPLYRRFDSDCTNFVSQSLFAGARPMLWGDYTADSSWWYSNYFSLGCAVYPRGCQALSWTVAKLLWANLQTVRAGMSVASTAYILQGDLIFTDWDNGANGVIDHVIFVSDRVCSGNSWSCILIDQHTNDRRRLPMSVTVALAHPAARYYAVRPTFY